MRLRGDNLQVLHGPRRGELGRRSARWESVRRGQYRQHAKPHRSEHNRHHQYASKYSSALNSWVFISLASYSGRLLR